ncbi:MAG: VOC family protein [Bacillota bacterium]|nr:VOC family protein [Bacillota bacterium]MDP4170225.1 VOC family protein [Bacillota bacterium]
MTNLEWDHTVHCVNNLDNAINNLKIHGLHASIGGSHTQWGTNNALCYFGLTYLEFLGVENRDIADKAELSVVFVKDAVSLLPYHEILSRIAIRTDDIEETAEAVRSHGLNLSPIIEGERLDQQGNLIQWRMLTIAGDFEGLAYPFFIQWKNNDEERTQHLSAAGLLEQHPAGNTTVHSAVFSVENPSAVAAHWQAIFGLSIRESDRDSWTVAIGDKLFIFQKGSSNRMEKINFMTESKELKGKTITIGEGQYVFS